MRHLTRSNAPSRGRAAMALLAVGGAAAIAGCGGEDASVAVAEAAERTAATDSAAVRVEATVEGEGLPEPVSFEGSGLVDNEAQTGRIEFEDFQLPGAAGDVLPAGALQGEVIFEELTMYMRFPLISQALPGGKEWMKVDVSEALGEQGVDLGELTQLTQTNPTDSLAQLQAVSNDLEEVGEEEVGGVPTTRYEATIDLNRYPELVPEEERAAAEESVANLIDLTGTESIPVEVWIDEDGLVRRMSQSYSYEAPETGAVSQSQTIEFSDFGVEVDVQPPPADEVFDATDLAAQAPTP